MTDEPRTPLNTTDEEMIERPDWWPLSTMLPVKRILGGEIQEMGYLKRYDLRLCVWQDGKVIADFPSAAHMVEAGWRVD